MSNGRNAGPQNTFNRSASGAVIRGALLLLVALVLGVVLLQGIDNPKSTAQVGGTTDTTAAATTDTTIAGGSTPIASTTTVVQRAPSTVKVLLVNGSGKNRAAARVKAFLGSSGYDLLVPRDAKATNYADRVSYTPGFEAEATAIGGLLGLTPDKIGPLPTEQTVKTPPEVPAFDVQIMVGQELAAKYATQSLTGATATTAAATATTVASAATTTAPA